MRYIMILLVVIFSGVVNGQDGREESMRTVYLVGDVGDSYLSDRLEAWEDLRRMYVGYLPPLADGRGIKGLGDSLVLGIHMGGSKTVNGGLHRYNSSGHHIYLGYESDVYIFIHEVLHYVGLGHYNKSLCLMNSVVKKSYYLSTYSLVALKRESIINYFSFAGKKDKERLAIEEKEAREARIKKRESIDYCKLAWGSDY